MKSTEPKYIEDEPSVWVVYRFEIILMTVCAAAFVFIAVCPKAFFDYVVLLLLSL